MTHEPEIEDVEDAQIVVDLKKLDIDLDKDVGRSIQKINTDESAEPPSVLKECKFKHYSAMNFDQL